MTVESLRVKVAPHSKESEMMVLGCMLTSINSLNVAADALDENDFYFNEHKIIFQVLKNAYRSDKPADIHIVAEELKRQGKLGVVGGVAYITTLAQYAGTSAYIEEYVSLVKNKAILRRMIHAAQVVEKTALEEPEDVHSALDEAQAHFFTIGQATSGAAGLHIRDLLLGSKVSAEKPFLKELQEKQEFFALNGSEAAGVTGVPSHFLDLDKMINGLNKSNLMILAARPAMGKCVTGDTLILDPVTGALVPIKDLVAKGKGHVATLDADWKLKKTTPSAFVADGVKNTYRVTTALGKEIEATAVHPLLTINGWKTLEELVPGDRIAVPNALPCFGSNRESIDLSTQVIEGTLAIEVNLQEIPDEVFTLTKQAVALVLKKIFTSATVSLEKEPLVVFTSFSQRLIEQLQHLLLRFGILARKEKGIKSFCLIIERKKDLLCFAEEISIENKEDVILELVEQALLLPLDDAESAYDVYWDKVVSIEPTGEKEVFDLSVADTHNFVAGDIIVHNTALALNIAENVCFKSKVPVGIFSLEMSAKQLLHRLICSQAGVESEKVKTGALNGMEFQRIVEAVGEMQQHTMIIDDQPGLKITDLRARARRMKENFNIGLLIIDYLQLITGSGNNRNAENRQIEISEISRLLKTLARELDIPIICLSQLSRKVEDRAGHRPMMSDLRESGCLAGDTLIQDAESGYMYTIKELAERTKQTPFLVNAVDDEMKIGHHKMVNVFYSGRKKVFELKTRTGRIIRASSNHPFLKIEGWTALENLRVGDKLGLPRRLTVKQPEANLGDTELTLLGHLIGDGCILPNQPYHYTSADEENIAFVRYASKSLFNIESRLVKQKNWFHVYLPSPVRMTHGRYHPITTWFSQLGLSRVRSYEKQLPAALFAQNDAKLALFLRHLWATDGNVSIKKMKGRQDTGAIYYSSSSCTLALQVQHLLLRLGIQSTLAKVASAKGYRMMYHVNVFSSTNQREFISKVGCAGKRGEVSAYLLQQYDKIQPSPSLDVIPKEVWHHSVKKAKEAHGLSWRAVSQGLKTAYCGSTLMKRGISRERMKTLHDFMPYPELKKLAESDIYWDEIVEIQEKGEEDVYDATVEGVHNFVANDIIVHNSIEQDSDIVMFLLRREYYDPLDKPGMAELIVAKNRHGAIGSVHLTYRKEVVQFANYTPTKAVAQAKTGGSFDEDDPFKDFS